MKINLFPLVFIFFLFPVSLSAETIYGTSAVDHIDVSDSTYQYEIFAKGGYDVITGSPQDDVIHGDSGNDIINGLNGHDSIIGGPGNDELYGGDGNDLFYVTRIEGYDHINGGNGQDSLIGSTSNDEFRIISLAGIEIIDGDLGNNIIRLSSGGRQLDLSSVVLKNIDFISDGWGNDFVVGTADNDLFASAHGNDKINGGDGFDTILYLNPYHDYELIDNTGVITVNDPSRKTGKDELTNIERIVFSNGRYEAGAFISDYPIGETPPTAKDDNVSTLYNLAVNINALSNDSDLDGDTLSIESVESPNNGVAFITSDNQITYIPAQQFTGIDSFTYSIADTTGLTSQATVIVNVLPDGTQKITLNGTGGIDTIDLSSSIIPHEIYARGGFDNITGSQADDIIFGEAGNDIINGHWGNDILIGGSGKDKISGDAGDDTILISGLKDNYDIVDGGPDYDVIQGSESDDKIGLQSIIQVEIIDGGQGYNFIEIAPGGRTLDLSTVTLINIQLIQGGIGNDTIIGTSDNDVISGGRGNDYIDGKDGYDTVSYNGKLANYRIATEQGVHFISDKVGKDGKDRLVNIELVRFTDQDFELLMPSENSSPVAIEDQASLNMNSSININVLSNDFDPDNNQIYIDSYSSPQHGDILLSGDSFKYTPVQGYVGQDSFSYTIVDDYGASSTPALVNLSITNSVVYTLEEIIAEMPSSSWKKINNNHFIDVWTPLKQRPKPIGNTIGKPDRIISAWSSMALDTKRSNLIFWGGGHANYAGNTVYLFNLNTLLWERASLPSDVYNVNNTGQYVTVDGTDHSPITAHTYDNQLYLPIIDRFITFGGSAFGNTKTFIKEDEVTITGPYLWDPNLADPDKVGGLSGSNVSPDYFPGVIGGGMWQNRDTIVVNGTGQYRPDWFVNGTTAYTQENGNDVVLVSESPVKGGDLFKYTIGNQFDPAFDAWEKVGIMSSSYFDQGAGAYASEKQLYIRTGVKAGEPAFVYWDLSNPGPNNPNHLFLASELSGGFTLSTLHGMDYDSFNQRFTLWDGSDEVWHLYPPEFLSENGWLIEKAKNAISEDQPQQSDGIRYAANGSIGNPFRGVLGKWKYSSNHGVFFGVLDPDAGDIWVYKP